MPDSHDQQPKKRSFDFGDIMSMLGDEKSVLAAPPAREPAGEKPEPVVKTAVPEPTVVKEPEPVAEPPQVAAQPDPTIVDRLLADFAQKNAEILRLNNELTQLRFELKEKEQQIAILEATEDELKKGLEAQIASKQAMGQEKDAALAAKNEELRAREAKINEIEARMNAMSEQFGVLRKFATRESSHEPYEEPKQADESPAIDVQEQAPAVDEDVASIFKRLAGAERDEEEKESGEEEKPPRKPRSAKLYDL